MQGYCLRERKRVEIANAEQVTLKNGRLAVQGTCPDCGVRISTIGRLPDHTESSAREQRSSKAEGETDSFELSRDVMRNSRLTVTLAAFLLGVLLGLMLARRD